MNIAPINFRGTHYLNKDNREVLQQELRNWATVRKVIYHVPPLINKSTKGDLLIQYTTTGLRADAASNPITKEHLKKLVEDFRRLDEVGALHEDLSLDNMYFYTDNENSKVELVNFRDMGFFNLTGKGVSIKSSRRMDDIGFELPSNAKNFEETGIQEYLTTIKDYRQKFDFVKEYLKIKSPYHSERALLRLKIGKADKSTEYEAIKGKVFEKPSKDIVKLEIAKIESGVGKLRNEAMKMWQKGSGKYGNEPDLLLRFNAVLLMYDALGSAVNLKETIYALAENKTDPNESRYFDLEIENIENLITNIFNQAKALGDDNFNNHDLYKGRKIITLGSDNDKEKFDNLCQAFKEAQDDDAETAKQKIDDIKKQYARLAARWIKEH